jgi:hypothetical protein
VEYRADANPFDQGEAARRVEGRGEYGQADGGDEQAGAGRNAGDGEGERRDPEREPDQHVHRVVPELPQHGGGGRGVRRRCRR